MIRADRTIDVSFVVVDVDNLKVGEVCKSDTVEKSRNVDISVGTHDIEVSRGTVDTTGDRKDLDISIDDVNVSVNVEGYTPNKNLGVSVEDVNVSLDLIDHESDDYEIEVVIGDIIKGDDGKDGRDGKDGYTPERGVDYWNQEDITYIQNYIDEQVDPIEWQTI